MVWVICGNWVIRIDIGLILVLVWVFSVFRLIFVGNLVLIVVSFVV